MITIININVLYVYKNKHYADLDYSEKFMKDVLGCNIASVAKSGKYKIEF